MAAEAEANAKHKRDVAKMQEDIEAGKLKPTAADKKLKAAFDKMPKTDRLIVGKFETDDERDQTWYLRHPGIKTDASKKGDTRGIVVSGLDSEATAMKYLYYFLKG